MSDKKDQDKALFYFDGFICPTTTPVPDQLFDILLPVLKEAELKVLLYIIRRTFGFKKNSDAISLTQICHGIKTREGKILDRGTGLDRRSVMRACKGLLEKNIIRLQRGINEEGVNQINIYSLNVKKTVVGEKSPYGSDQNVSTVEVNFPHGSDFITPPPEENYPPQQTDNTINSLQDTEQQQCASLPELTNALTALGLKLNIISKLIKSYPEVLIHRQLQYLPYRKAENPPALFIKALNEDWPAPPEYLKRQAKQRQALQELEAAEASKNQEVKIQRLQDSLAPEKLNELKALARAKCLEESGPIFNNKDIPEIIINAYVHEIIKSQFLT